VVKAEKAELRMSSGVVDMKQHTMLLTRLSSGTRNVCVWTDRNAIPAGITKPSQV
jgi:hypothetical protein